MAQDSPILVALIAALLGAVGAGVVQAALRWIDNRRQVKVVRASLAMEVTEVCRLMRFRKFAELTERLVAELRVNPNVVGAMAADLREDYFTVFHALSPQLGKLKPTEAAKIVQFYMICKSAKDTISPDGMIMENEEHSLALENAEQLLVLLRRALLVGDEISQWLPPSVKLLAENG